MMLQNYNSNPYVTLIMLLFCHTMIQDQSHPASPFHQKQIIVTFKNDNWFCPDKLAINKLMTLMATDILQYVRVLGDNTVIFRLNRNDEFCAESILYKLPFVEYIEEDIMVQHYNIKPILFDDYDFDKKINVTNIV